MRRSQQKARKRRVELVCDLDVRALVADRVQDEAEVLVREVFNVPSRMTDGVMAMPTTCVSEGVSRKLVS
jgi:hypothetical protein